MGAKKDVLEGIKHLNYCLYRELLVLPIVGCEALKDEFSGIIWDQKAAERGEDKPEKKGDHGPDAARYYAEKWIPRFRVTGSAPTLASIGVA